MPQQYTKISATLDEETKRILRQVAKEHKTNISAAIRFVTSEWKQLKDKVNGNGKGESA